MATQSTSSFADRDCSTLNASPFTSSSPSPSASDNVLQPSRPANRRSSSRRTPSSVSVSASSSELSSAARSSAVQRKAAQNMMSRRRSIAAQIPPELQRNPVSSENDENSGSVINVTVDSHTGGVQIKKPAFSDKLDRAMSPPPQLDNREAFFARRRSQRDWKPAVVDSPQQQQPQPQPQPQPQQQQVAAASESPATPQADRWDGSMPRRKSSRSFIDRKHVPSRSFSNANLNKLAAQPQATGATESQNGAQTSSVPFAQVVKQQPAQQQQAQLVHNQATKVTRSPKPEVLRRALEEIRAPQPEPVVKHTPSSRQSRVDASVPPSPTAPSGEAHSRKVNHIIGQNAGTMRLEPHSAFSKQAGNTITHGAVASTSADSITKNDADLTLQLQRSLEETMREGEHAQDHPEDTNNAPLPPCISLDELTFQKHSCKAESLDEGRWCNKCAGVGLVVSALLAEHKKKSETESPEPSTSAMGGRKVSAWRTVVLGSGGDSGSKAKLVAENNRLQKENKALYDVVHQLQKRFNEFVGEVKGV